MFLHYVPAEEKDAQDTKAKIAEVAPKAKVELYGDDLRSEENTMKMAEAIKQWSGDRVDVL